MPARGCSLRSLQRGLDQLGSVGRRRTPKPLPVELERAIEIGRRAELLGHRCVDVGAGFASFESAGYCTVWIVLSWRKYGRAGATEADGTPGYASSAP